MRNSWYLRCAGVESGPVVFEKIVELARQGRIAPTDQVRRSDEQFWRAAADVEELFGSQSADEESPDSLFDDILDTAAEDDGSHISGQRVGTRLEDQAGYDPHHASVPAQEVRFYCRVQGKESGPFTLPELQRRADEGLISPFDRVRNASSKAWIPAQEISDIRFSTQPAAPSRSREPSPAPDASQQERPATARSRAPSVDSLIDEVLGAEADSIEPDPLPTPKAVPRQAAAPPIARPESRAEETEPRHSSTMASAIAAASAAPAQKPKSKEKRVPRSGPKLQFEMPGKSLITALVVVALVGLVLTWMRTEGTPPVSGTVTVDGEPLPIGSITFQPFGIKGKPLTVAVIDGEFAAGQEEVLGVGKHKVRVIIGNPMGNAPAELSAVPKFATLNGAILEREIDTSSVGEDGFVFEFAAGDAKIPSESSGDAFSLE
jgi:hypothetical protein